MTVVPSGMVSTWNANGPARFLAVVGTSRWQTSYFDGPNTRKWLPGFVCPPTIPHSFNSSSSSNLRCTQTYAIQTTDLIFSQPWIVCDPVIRGANTQSCCAGSLTSTKRSLLFSLLFCSRCAASQNSILRVIKKWIHQIINEVIELSSAASKKCF